jgi:hypothetical protein
VCPALGKPCQQNSCKRKKDEESFHI